MDQLSVRGLKTYYLPESPAPVRAVDGVSFQVRRGTSLGIAGESGCGKSTAALSLMRLVKGGKIVGGEILLDDLSLLTLKDREFNRVRWERISLVSQAAMNALNPVFKIGHQIVETILAHRKTGTRQAWKMAEALLEQVEIEPSRVRSFPHELSGGMRQRAMIALALALDPELIIADEPTTALDVVTQAQIIKLLRRLQRERGIAVIFISHDLSILGQACDRILIMYAGTIVEEGDTDSIFESPFHPYTRALLNSFPDIREKRKHLKGLPGNPPDLSNPPSGCRFHPRCPSADPLCSRTPPLLREAAPGRSVACHHIVDKGGK
ncbi:MAG: ABC transporter ATP-binding protein [Deltaproteobacteria bacterium]|nr:ABC transporter ATP-binding protein [Deltaproteobacteria bacterium]